MITTTQDRLPPHAAETEDGLLGCILISPDDCMNELAASGFDGERFYQVHARTLYAALRARHDARMPMDVVSVCQGLTDAGKLAECGGWAFVAALPDKTPSAHMLSAFAAEVTEKWKQRQVIAVSTSTAAAAHDLADTAESLTAGAIEALQRLDQSAGSRVVETGPALHLLVNDLQRRSENHIAGRRSGLVTGLRGLDHLTDGLQAGEQFVIGARPSVGKTALGWTLVERICIRDGHRTAVVTLEMSTTALLRRGLSSLAQIPMGNVRRGQFSEDEMPRAMDFQTTIRAAPLVFVDGVCGLTIRQVVAELRRLHRKAALAFVLIDYLQKIRSSGGKEKRTHEVAEVSEGLKAFARESGAALVTLAQLNRESEKDKGRMPRLGDLRECGDIEQDADTVALIHRDKGDSATPAKLIVAKQRDGEIGSVDLKFNSEFCRFENHSPIDHKDYDQNRHND